MTVALAARKPIHETHAVAEDGAVDADGHILEPPDLWETYIDPAFRDRALRIVLDENGLEELEIDGQRSQMSRRGFPSTLGAMGAPDLAAMHEGPGAHLPRARRRTARWTPRERIDVLDAEHIDTVILYTTVGLLWEAEVEDPALSQAYTKAYNRWICEFCADEPRLVPTAHLSLCDPSPRPRSWSGPSARAPRAGTSPRSPTTAGRSAIPTTTPCSPPPRTSTCRWRSTRRSSRSGRRAPAWARGSTSSSSGCWRRCRRPTASATSSRRCSTTACSTRFPRLKILVLESGGGWIGYWLDRIDAVYGHTFIGERVPLQHKPSDYFRERIWISCDPDERMIPALAERYGVERFLWASDFPHADHTPEYIHDLNELVASFPEPDRAKFVGGNARALFKL